MKTKESMKLALRLIGAWFTQEWTKRDENYKSFTMSAEDCLDQVVRLQIFLVFILIMFFIDILALILGVKISCLIPVLFVVIMTNTPLVITYFRLAKYIGSTARIISRHWSEYRCTAKILAKTLIRELDDSSFNIDAKYSPTTERIETALKFHIDQCLRNLAIEVQRAKADGLPKLEKRFRFRFERIHDFAWLIGFDAGKWDPYFKNGPMIIKRVGSEK